MLHLNITWSLILSLLHCLPLINNVRRILLSCFFFLLEDGYRLPKFPRMNCLLVDQAWKAYYNSCHGNGIWKCENQQEAPVNKIYQIIALKASHMTSCLLPNDLSSVKVCSISNEVYYLIKFTCELCFNSHKTFHFKCTLA